MRRSRLVVPLLVLTTAVAGCTDDEPAPEPGPHNSSPPLGGPVSLTFGVWGHEEEIAAYQGVVDTYNATQDDARVEILPYADSAELLSAIVEDDGPDIYQVLRGDLPLLREQEANRPVGTLLDERDVEFGDGYSRVALEAFAGERELQCMPYGISPMVIYYNRQLVDFETMADRGLDVPNLDDEDLTKKPAWSLEQFQAAADFSSRPRRGVAGFYVAPTLTGLAPFVYSAGGQIYSDDDEPTSLDFSSDDTRSALEQVLPVLRDPTLMLSPEQLAEKSPLEWFQQGGLGMIAGYRDLVPTLRAAGVDFDIMPMPVVDDAATVGDLSGICISENAADVAESADFLVDLISTESVSAVTASGYLAPANTEVALSEVFLQPGRAPLHSAVSNNSIRNMRIPPLVPDYEALEDAVAAPLRELLEVEVPDLELLTEQIDEASQTVLAPPESEEDEDGDSSPSEDTSD